MASPRPLSSRRKRCPPLPYRQRPPRRPSQCRPRQHQAHALKLPDGRNCRHQPPTRHWLALGLFSSSKRLGHPNLRRRCRHPCRRKFWPSRHNQSPLHPKRKRLCKAAFHWMWRPKLQRLLRKRTPLLNRVLSVHRNSRFRRLSQKCRPGPRLHCRPFIRKARRSRKSAHAPIHRPQHPLLRQCQPAPFRK